jgi:outer membrane phospholipase A
MKKLLTIILLLTLAIPVISKEYEYPMSLYKENYFAFGDKDANVKFQISAKYNVFYPSSTGIYFAYTQRSKWALGQEPSSPFKESNYMPEVFYKLESKNNIFGNIDLKLIDYIQLSPIYHCSNGRDGEESRSMNTSYGQIQISVGEKYNFGINAKYFRWYQKKELEKYLGHYETDIFFKFKSTNIFLLDKEELHFKFGGYEKADYNSWDNEKKTYGWYTVEGRFRIFTTIIQPQIFIQYYNGYAQWLINYYEKEKSLRIGLVF